MFNNKEFRSQKPEFRMNKSETLARNRRFCGQQ